jgi:hypothetical protein
MYTLCLGEGKELNARRLTRQRLPTAAPLPSSFSLRRRRGGRPGAAPSFPLKIRPWSYSWWRRSRRPQSSVSPPRSGRGHDRRCGARCNWRCCVRRWLRGRQRNPPPPNRVDWIDDAAPLPPFRPRRMDWAAASCTLLLRTTRAPNQGRRADHSALYMLPSIQHHKSTPGQAAALVFSLQHHGMLLPLL